MVLKKEGTKMKINHNQQISTIKPKLTSESKLTSEPISKETMKDFPDLNTGYHMYNGPAYSSTMGYETPVNDQVYIGKRSKELEADLTAIPPKMKILKTCHNAAEVVKVAGAVTFVASLGCSVLAAMGASIPGSVMMGMLVAGGATLMTGDIASETTNSAMHKNWINYYDGRTELDHLRRGETWSDF